MKVDHLQPNKLNFTFPNSEPVVGPTTHHFLETLDTVESSMTGVHFVYHIPVATTTGKITTIVAYNATCETLYTFNDAKIDGNSITDVRWIFAEFNAISYK